jgi:AcrR family transcriptional regulator
MRSMDRTCDDPDQLGLRERKKRATRRALQRAALSLACDRGPDVTVEEICAAAEVSPRTFFNYFSAKEEAILGEPPAVPSDATFAAYEQGGPTGDLVTDLRDTLGPHLTASLPTIHEMHLRKQVLDAHPELLPHLMGGFMAIERRLVLATARRTGTDVADLHPQLVASVASAAMRLSVHRWITSGGVDPVAAHVHAVFDELASTF